MTRQPTISLSEMKLNGNGAKTTSKTKKPVETIGFGCPDITDPHYFEVTIPRGRTAPVMVTEHFGVFTGMFGTEYIERVSLARERWKAIADDLQRILNERLKEQDLKPGRWQTGENKLDQFLGKELTVLAWAVEHADIDLIPVAIKNWAGLKPEERLWLFTVTAAATGGVMDGDRGWRKALRYALTENPTDIKPVRKKQAAPKKSNQKQLEEESYETLSLFEIDESPSP